MTFKQKIQNLYKTKHSGETVDETHQAVIRPFCS